MNVTGIKKAVREANRFVDSANIVLNQEDEFESTIHVGRDSASLRRASMDLTRSLADMRKR